MYNDQRANIRVGDIPEDVLHDWRLAALRALGRASPEEVTARCYDISVDVLKQRIFNRELDPVKGFRYHLRGLARKKQIAVLREMVAEFDMLDAEVLPEAAD